MVTVLNFYSLTAKKGDEKPAHEQNIAKIWVHFGVCFLRDAYK